MNRNVTEFQHFIAQPQITENDLNWVINLRDNNIPAQVPPSNPQPPEVFFKRTKAFEIRCKSQEQQVKKYHANEYDHMILKHPQAAKQTEEQIHFYSTLRSNENHSPNATIGNAQRFDTRPFKDRK